MWCLTLRSFESSSDCEQRMTTLPSPQRRQEIVGALRRGTVPQRGLDAFAVGLDRLAPTIDEELRTVAGGGAQFKAVRGDYGSGKTFFSRWLCERAKAAGFATSEVQISETETPLHRLETVYRRLVERLATADVPQGALRTVLERWGFTLEEDVLATGEVAEHDEVALQRRVDELMEGRLAQVSRSAPPFATALRAHRAALAWPATSPWPTGFSRGSAGSRTCRPPSSAPPASRARSTTSAP